MYTGCQIHLPFISPRYIQDVVVSYKLCRRVCTNFGGLRAGWNSSTVYTQRTTSTSLAFDHVLEESGRRKLIVHINNMATIEDWVDNIHHHLMSSTPRFVDSHCFLAGVHVQVVHVPTFTVRKTPGLQSPFVWFVRHVLSHRRTSLESDDAFVNGAFPLQVEVKLPFRQKVVEKRADFEQFVVIWMVAWSVALVIVQMEEG